MDITALNDTKVSFQNIIQVQRENPQLDIEEQKLRLIQRLYDDLLEKIELEKPIILSTNLSEEQSSYLYWLYKSLMISSLFKHSMSSFLFGITLLELIPGLSHLTTVIISIIYSCLDSVIFYAIEISYLKRALHIADDNNAVCELLDNYKQQLHMLQFMNQELSSVRSLQLTKEEYKAYHECLACMNEDMKSKLSSIQNYQESSYKIIIKYFMISIGTFSKIAASYFIAKSLLITLAAPLIGTPLGCLFIAVIVFGGAGFFYALGEHSITKLMHPEMENFKQLTLDFSIFKQELKKHQKTNEMIINFFQKSSHDVETQTSELLFSH